MKEREKKERMKPGTKRKRIIGPRGKEPIDYGVTKKQFFEILDKASQPTKNGGQTQNNEAKEKH
jgi:hypothetical protein